jgi:hypothetical protein
MKKIRNILIMLIILVLLLVVYLVASPMWRESGDETTEPTPSYTVAVIDHNTIVGLELEHGEEKLSFSLNEGGTAWNWSENAEVPLDNMVFANAVTALNEASSSYKLEGVTADQLAEYGLAEPSLRAKFIFLDGSTREFIFGNLNSFNSLYYFTEASATDTVYMVSSSVKASLELDIYDFILEETPPAITEGKILGVSTVNASNYADFTYYPSGKDNDYTDQYNWYCRTGLTQMSSLPPELPIDSTMADTLTGLITSLSFEECVGLDDSDEKYGFSESKKIVVRYNVDETENGVLTEKKYVIYIGSQREDGGIYAHTADSKLVYILSSSDEWISFISPEKPKLLPDEIWLPNYERVDSLTFKAAGNTLTVNVNNTDGKISYSSTASDDIEAIEALIAKLDALKATSNVAYLKDEEELAQKELMLAVKIAFNKGESSELEIEITRYSQSYCRVKFGHRNDQLITLEDAEALIGLVTEIAKAA